MAPWRAPSAQLNRSLLAGGGRQGRWSEGGRRRCSRSRSWHSAASPPTLLPQQVIDDVCAKVKGDFVQEGVDE